MLLPPVVPPAKDKTRTELLWWAALAVFAVLLCYSNHFQNHFQFDDSHTIVRNVWIRNLKSIPLFFTDATTFSALPANRAWRPVVSASLAIDYWLGGGLKPVWFHASTFFWYLVQLALMFVLYRRIPSFANSASGTADAGFAALFATAWYGLHPAMAETVNYIIQRGDLYAALGVVASLAVWILFPKLRSRGLYLCPFILGILAKPVAAIFPAVLLAWIFLFEEDANFANFGRALARSGPAIAVTVLMLILESKMTAATYIPGIISAHDYIVTQPYVMLHYFISFFLPVTLSADSDLAPFPSLFTTEGLIGLVFVLCLLWAIIHTARRPGTRPIAFGLLWFLLTLLPTSLFPLSEIENDHRMFLPFIGLALAVTGSLALAVAARPRIRPRAAGAGAVLLLCAYGQGAWQRNRVWSTEETLWKDVTLKSPRNGRGLMNYGFSLMGRGQTAEALNYFERAAQFVPNYYILEINRGVASGALGNDREAEAHFARALQLQRDDAQPYFFYARWLHQKHRDPEAIALLEVAVQKYPADADSRYQLMNVYADAGMAGNLQKLAAETLRIVPGDPVALRYQNADVRASLPEQAADSVAVAEGTAKGHPSPENYLELSLVYHRARRFRDSISAAGQALKLKPDYAEAYNNLAAAHEELFEWDQAIQAAATAVKLKPDFQLAKNNLAWAISQKARTRP